MMFNYQLLAPAFVLFLGLTVFPAAASQYGQAVFGQATFGAAAIATSLPDSPMIINVVPGDNELTIVFSQGNGGVSTITNYEYSLNGGTWVPFSPPTNSSPVTITGLTNGTSYLVALRAVNSLGTSSAAQASSAVAPTPDSIQTIPALPNWALALLISLLMGLTALKRHHLPDY